MRSRRDRILHLNDCAIVARKLIAAGKRVACLDILDAHHGDGTQALLTIAARAHGPFHETGRTLFPGTGFRARSARAMGRGTASTCQWWPVAAMPGTLALMKRWSHPAGAYKPDVIVLMVGAMPTFRTRCAPFAHVAWLDGNRATMWSR